MKQIYHNKNIIGADETGVGDYLTPLVAAAVFVPFNNIHKLLSLGVTDSKKLTDQKILKLAPKIKPLVSYAVKHLTQKGYNKLNNTFNANELKMFLHISAINFVEQKVNDQDLIIIDKFSTEQAIKKYYHKLLKSSFNFQPFKAKLKLVTKGESEHIAVAAASIIAREKLLLLMTIQNRKWNTNFPFGTNSIVENFTKNFLKKHGQKTLNEIAKIKFKTTKKIMETLI